MCVVFGTVTTRVVTFDGIDNAQLIRSRVQVPSEGLEANGNLGLQSPSTHRDQGGFMQQENGEAPAHLPAHVPSLLPLHGQEARASIRQLRDFLLGVSAESEQVSDFCP